MTVGGDPVSPWTLTDTRIALELQGAGCPLDLEVTVTTPFDSVTQRLLYPDV